MKKFILIFLIFGMGLSGQDIESAGKVVKQGDFFMLSLPHEEGLKVKFPESHTEIKWYKKDESSISFVPVHYSAAPGTYPLKVYKGGEVIYQDLVEVVEADFKKSYITVKKNMEKKRSSENIRTMVNHAREARKESAPEKLWTGKFGYPVVGSVSSPFGAMRYVNDKLSGYHSGTDFAVPIGRDVVATNSGRVVLGMYLNSTGNTVIIDHGLNIFSSYAHLDSMSVEEGSEVSRGELIGKSGNTGFTTGPHLHFTMSVGNTFVDPFLFLEKIPF